MFKFELRDLVRIKCSGETGEVIGRADYVHCSDTFYIRYKCADGRAVESWWSEEALELDE